MPHSRSPRRSWWRVRFSSSGLIHLSHVCAVNELRGCIVTSHCGHTIPMKCGRCGTDLSVYILLLLTSNHLMPVASASPVECFQWGWKGALGGSLKAGTQPSTLIVCDIDQFLMISCFLAANSMAMKRGFPGFVAKTNLPNPGHANNVCEWGCVPVASISLHLLMTQSLYMLQSV